MPFGQYDPSVYIGPALKYFAPILSLDLSEDTGNGSCFSLQSRHSSKLELTNHLNEK